jgi:hypothetical protein
MWRRRQIPAAHRVATWRRLRRHQRRPKDDPTSWSLAVFFSHFGIFIDVMQGLLDGNGASIF